MSKQKAYGRPDDNDTFTYKQIVEAGKVAYDSIENKAHKSEFFNVLLTELWKKAKE